MSIEQLLGLFNSSERLRASNELIVRHTESPDLVVDALIKAILPEDDRKSYRVNIYIVLTLSQLRPNWVGVEEQKNRVAALQNTDNYKDATFSLRVNQALNNFRQQ